MKTKIETTKQKLIELVSALQEENIIDYCYTFIGLKVYGAAKLPESIIEELREIQEKHVSEHEIRHEQTVEEKQAGEYRCNIIRMLCDINNPAILNYIRMIVEDVAKEDKKGDAEQDYISIINKLLCEIKEEKILHYVYVFVSDIAKELKGGVE